MDGSGQTWDTEAILMQFVPHYTLEVTSNSNVVWHSVNDANQKIVFNFQVGNSDVSPSAITDLFHSTIHFMLRRIG